MNNATNHLTAKQAKDCRDIPVSYNDAEAIAGMEEALECALSFRGDAIAVIDRVLEEHPDFIMGWLFKAGWMTQAMETRIYDEMVSAVKNGEQRITRGNDRERGHLEAVTAWINGDFLALCKNGRPF